jgi:hypothetical protein
MATARMDAQNKEDAATMCAEDAVFSPAELTVSDRTAIETGLKKDRAAAQLEADMQRPDDKTARLVRR